METEIFYYSGTGNSLWAARCLSQLLGSARVRSMKTSQGETIPTDARTVVLVFPVYIYGVPRPVLKFIGDIPRGGRAVFHSVATNGGSPGSTLPIVARRLARRGAAMRSGLSLLMPSNYTPMGGPEPAPVQRDIFLRARGHLERLARDIRDSAEGTIDSKPDFISASAYWLTLPLVHGMDMLFWVQDGCTACGICERLCPSGNIVMKKGLPTWHRRCEQCLACLQWCPQTAIQWGKRTERYERYHHPEVTLAEMMAGVRDVSPERKRSGL